MMYLLVYLFDQIDFEHTLSGHETNYKFVFTSRVYFI